MELVSPGEAHRFLRRLMSRDVEEFWVVALSSRKSPLRAECLFRGSVDVCLFHPRDVFRFGCRNNSAALIVAHNHPSGDVQPSPQDEAVNQQLLAAAMILQIPVVDHLIVAGRCYFSFLQAGRMVLTRGDSNARRAPDDP